MRRVTVAVLAMASLVTLTSTAQAVVPQDGEQYPRGTAIESPACASQRGDYPNMPPQDGDTVAISSSAAALSGGGQGYVGTISAPECEPISVDALGDYLLEVQSVSWVEEWCCGSWATRDEQQDVQQIRFSVVESDTCLEFTSVSDGHGNELGEAQLASLGIPGRRLGAGGTLRVPTSSSIPKGVELELPDGTKLRIARGGVLRFGDNCVTSQDEEWHWRDDLRVVLGKIWLTVGGGDGPEPRVATERAVAGPRGTAFSVAYHPKRERTTIRVTAGKVHMAPIHRPKRGLVLRAGQTGVQRGSGPVRRVR